MSTRRGRSDSYRCFSNGKPSCFLCCNGSNRSGSATGCACVDRAIPGCKWRERGMLRCRKRNRSESCRTSCWVTIRYSPVPYQISVSLTQEIYHTNHFLHVPQAPVHLPHNLSAHNPKSLCSHCRNMPHWWYLYDNCRRNKGQHTLMFRGRWIKARSVHWLRVLLLQLWSRKESSYC